MKLVFALAGLVLSGVVYAAETAEARALAAREAAWGEAIRAGDLVFQDIDCGERCALIRQITRSRYAHVGVVVGEGAERAVWEAYGPVGPVPLDAWVARGRGGDVAVYRPPASLRAARPSVEAELRAMRGRPYDGDYQWDEARIYCSELVAKAYASALGRAIWAPHPVYFGAHAPRIAALSGGRLTETTPMVTPRDLITYGGFTRVVDELER
jgi:hypothetical protein